MALVLRQRGEGESFFRREKIYPANYERSGENQGENSSEGFIEQECTLTLRS